MCARAGVDCTMGQPKAWVNYGIEDRAQKTNHPADESRNPKRRRTILTEQVQSSSSEPSTSGIVGSSVTGVVPASDQVERVAFPGSEHWRNSTSTMVLVEEVGQQTLPSNFQQF